MAKKKKYSLFLTTIIKLQVVVPNYISLLCHLKETSLLVLKNKLKFLSMRPFQGTTYKDFCLINTTAALVFNFAF